MTSRLDDLVGRTLGIIDDAKPPVQSNEGLNMDLTSPNSLKDDTRPFKISRS
jgi:hypothetical protein